MDAERLVIYAAACTPGGGSHTRGDLVALSDLQSLGQLLHRIDGRGYRAYKEIGGSYRLGGELSGAVLHVEHVQGDPYAAPSRLRLVMPQDVADLPAASYANRSRSLGTATCLARAFHRAARARAKGGGSRGEGGHRDGFVEIDHPRQHVLERTCMAVCEAGVEARFFAGLPSSGRRIHGRRAAELLCECIPAIAADALRRVSLDAAELAAYADTTEDADALRGQLRQRGLVAFVADGSLLPRRSGIDERPLDSAAAVAFQSPPSLRVELEAPNAGTLSGMGIPEGITLIVGGGFHGKSTLLDALLVGVYDHIPGDGRHRVVADPAAVAIRAEDGRRVEGVDVSPFIGELPLGRDTRAFRTENASGSTSQAANIVEALEAGARLLLVDEDTAATNFMIRDGRMQQLVARQREPITPFIDRVRQLYDEHGVSTVLVMGGSGDYFDVADTVIVMDEYRPRDATAEARCIAAASGRLRQLEAEGPFGPVAPRVPVGDSIDLSRGRREVSARGRGRSTVLLGPEAIDLTAVQQLVDPSQTRSVAAALAYARQHYVDGRRSVAEILDAVAADVDAGGLDVLTPHRVADGARFRRFELAAALNRLRTLRVHTLEVRGP